MKLDDKVALITARHKVSASELPNASCEPAAAWRSPISICNCIGCGRPEGGGSLRTMRQPPLAGRGGGLSPPLAGAPPTRSFLKGGGSQEGGRGVPPRRRGTKIFFPPLNFSTRHCG